MVCVAAFIILCLASVVVGILSIFRRDIGKKYLKIFKKSWGCVGKKVTFQKCDTNFKDDVKNTILRKVVIKKPKLVKPLSITIEVLSVLIVIITAWSLVESAKAGLALWTLGTCNVEHPSSCSLGSGGCSIDGDDDTNAFVRWFEDWGEIFSAVPDKFRSWEVSEFDFVTIAASSNGEDKPGAIDIMDPGCEVCLRSFKTQLESGFFEKYNVKIVPFPILDGDGSYKFANSKLITSYILAVDQQGHPAEKEDSEGSSALNIFRYIFLDKEKIDGIPHSYQDLFNNQYNAEQAEAKLKEWLAKDGYSEAEISEIEQRAKSEQISQQLEKNDNLVKELHIKSIPSMIYDGRKHAGEFKEN